MTKEEKKEYSKLYYQKNKDKIKQYYKNNKEEKKEKISFADKKYKENNKEKLKQYQKERYQKNKTYYKEYYENNKEKIILQTKEYIENNKEKRLIQSKQYYKNNKEKIIDYNIIYINKKIQSNTLFKLTLNIRCLIRQSIKKNGHKKNSKTELILGCSFEDFKNHLESKFQSWMSWNNQGKYNGELNYGWDIDHIIPLSSADIEEDIIRLNHYTNLQPLCSKVNREIKKDKLDYEMA
jgi:hypothetical protein